MDRAHPMIIPEPNICAPVKLNLLNSLWEGDKMPGKAQQFYLFRNLFNKFN